MILFYSFVSPTVLQVAHLEGELAINIIIEFTAVTLKLPSFACMQEPSKVNSYKQRCNRFLLQLQAVMVSEI